MWMRMDEMFTAGVKSIKEITTSIRYSFSVD